VRGQRHAPGAPYPWEKSGTHCTGGRDKTINFGKDFDLFSCQSLLGIALKNGDKIWDYLSAGYEDYHILDMIPCRLVNTDIVKKSTASDFHGRFVPKLESVRKHRQVSI